MLFDHKFTSKLESPGRSATLDKHWPSILSQLSVSLRPGGDQRWRWWWISKSLRGVQKKLWAWHDLFIFFTGLRCGWNANLFFWYLWFVKKKKKKIWMTCCSLIRDMFLFSWNCQLMPPDSCCEILAAFPSILLHASSLLLRNHCCGLLIVALLLSILVWVVCASVLASSWMVDKVLS